MLTPTVTRQQIIQNLLVGVEDGHSGVSAILKRIASLFSGGQGRAKIQPIWYNSVRFFNNSKDMLVIWDYCNQNLYQIRLERLSPSILLMVYQR